MNLEASTEILTVIEYNLTSTERLSSGRCVAAVVQHVAPFGCLWVQGQQHIHPVRHQVALPSTLVGLRMAPAYLMWQAGQQAGAS
jgi:hypothetical protein